MELVARAFLWVILVGLLIAIPRWTRTHDNITELARLKEDVERLQDQKYALEMDNARIADHIVALGHSSNARIHRAIQRFDLLRSDELLLRFDEED